VKTILTKFDLRDTFARAGTTSAFIAPPFLVLIMKSSFENSMIHQVLKKLHQDNHPGANRESDRVGYFSLNL